MNNPQRAIVNQRLYFSRLHLTWLSDILDQGDIPAHVTEQALTESASFHMVQAYRAYLAEIAAAYVTPCEDLLTVEDLISRLEHNNKESSEAREIQELIRNGWLGDLLQGYEAISGAGQGASAGAASVMDIPVRQVSEGLIGVKQCHGYLESLKQLIEQQRSRLEEW